VIQLGIIGCGDVAMRTYIPALEHLADRAQVVATFDPIEERARQAAARFSAATAYTTYADLLNHPGLTGVFNLTPAPFHRDTTTAALDKGLHVFTEKPIAATVEDARALIAHAKERDRLLLSAPAVMATVRFRWLKKIVDAGRLGRLTLATAQMANMGPAGWRAYTGDPAVFYAANVGPVLDIGVYSLHAITGLFGPAKRVQAMGAITIPERNVLIPRLAGQKITVGAKDHMLIQLDFGGAFAQILASFAVPASKAPALEVHGTNGTVSVSMDQWYNAQGPVDVMLRDDTLLGIQGWTNGVGSPEGTGPAGDHLIGAGPEHFVACLRGEEQPILTPEHATHVLEIILKSDQSADEGRALELETSF
jgi:predicted dehydrogenase